MLSCRLRYFSTTGSSSCNSCTSVSSADMAPPVICVCGLQSIYLCPPVASSSSSARHATVFRRRAGAAENPALLRLAGRARGIRLLGLPRLDGGYMGRRRAEQHVDAIVDELLA